MNLSLIYLRYVQCNLKLRLVMQILMEVYLFFLLTVKKKKFTVSFLAMFTTFILVDYSLAVVQLDAVQLEGE